jgi:hypothetical protein
MTNCIANRDTPNGRLALRITFGIPGDFVPHPARSWCTESGLFSTCYKSRMCLLRSLLEDKVIARICHGAFMVSPQVLRHESKRRVTA